MRRGSKALCAAVALVAASGSLVALPVTGAAQPPPLPVPATAGALPTPQTDGIVFSVAIVGNTVVAGGRFTKARPAGVAPGGPGEVRRDNLLAFDLHTGELLPWAPVVSGSTFAGPDPGPFCEPADGGRWVCDAVFRIKPSPDGRKVYVGGDFDKIDGQWRSRVAAFDAVTGALDPAFRPQVAGRVRGLSVTADSVYLGGGFNAVGGVPRTRLAAVSASDGALLPWAPAADREVFAVLAAPELGRVVVGGAFDHVNGVYQHGLTAVDTAGGARVPWQWVTPSDSDTITDLVTDGTGTVYLGSYNWRGGNPRLEGRGAVEIATGRPLWMDGCYGDTQGVAVADGVLYSASHTHDCWAINAVPENGPIDYHRLLAETTAATGAAQRDINHVRRGDPIPELLPWLPNTNGGPSTSPWLNGPWTVDARSGYVVVGGEFTVVNGVPQQSLTRFAARGVPGVVNNGPQVPFPAPRLSRRLFGGYNITWNGTWDAQNREVRYEVMRAGTPEPLHVTTAPAWPWTISEMRFTDQRPPQGRVEYWVRAVDADGAVLSSPHSTIG
ncbi:putative pyrroloquinoline-quinone binding quinoprotein [Saccharopolyspora erythraea NRRL 2338]|uniref:Uncharacterized protein n=2 Tax=Saccharopolyspora erythraea TaxID=1836 RepID=A4FEI2_SACEN|nr:PQQ-binding-like beta-propeller repeat protein [Saccharopolyspora erythraea]EQD83007.1 hypothetical protein N599_27535 [Saccharopolyspora erythraea D]PFG96182.1 putative pyrroloquinoline-quinone binding quinoprotein [Saccharopolyspora erythraea NRRL 2338]QRK92714.1 PQQ-binding-like beta-propeller repeat protein [Saccharopolyspora erythraea]CAM02457.1 hypothetical protein SACE_3181 [Saccharopolyspora erythraea NRRL 2338]